MFQLGNYGLALTHSFLTGNTLAFLHGWHVFGDRNGISGERIVSHSEKLHRLLRSSRALWQHPLLLPLLLLQEHLYRADEFRYRTVSSEMRGIEKELCVTKTGRLVHMRDAVPEKIRELLTNDEMRLQLTTRVNTAMTDSINLATVLRWDQRVAQFIQRVDKELQPYYRDIGIFVGLEKDFRAALDHLSCEAVTATEYIDSISSRLDIQLNVVGARQPPSLPYNLRWTAVPGHLISALAV
jgi:hypothetical protein